MRQTGICLRVQPVTLLTGLVLGLLSGEAIAADSSSEANPPWLPLFDGKTLTGWTQRNGTATYRVEEDTIVGRTSEGSPNSFLCTMNEYEDFELRFEVKVDDPLNSGVQFRSRSRADFKNFRVHGPQVEIAVNGSAGRVYGEAIDTGWLDKDPPSPAAQKAFKRGEWNRYLVKAVGNRTRTWVNDVPVADFADDESGMRRGFISLQVHGIRKGSGPFEVRWRNLTIRDFTVRKVVFIGTGGGHGNEAHQHTEGNHLFAEALRNSGRRFATSEYDGWPKDAKAFEGADAVVIYCNGGAGHLVMPHLEKFNELMRQGVGLVCLHYAVEVPEGRAGDLMLQWIGGYFETHWSVNPHWKADFTSIPAHPVTRGVAPFSMEDEWYYHMRFAKDMIGVTPLLSAHPPESTVKRPDGPHSNNLYVRGAVRRSEIQHLAWAYQRPDDLGAGRGFGTTGGHWHKNWDQPDYLKTVLNAIVWVAGADVPPDGVSAGK